MTYNPYANFRQSSFWHQPYGGGTGAAGQMPGFGGTQPMVPPTTNQTGAMTPGSGIPPQGPQIPGMLPLEQSYIENILRLNKGKLTTVYAIFDVSANGNGTIREFTGIIEAAGRDHLILSDPQSGTRYLIPMVYFGYATFQEELEYEYPFGAAMPGAATYSPR
jgi:spore germination protein Q